MIDFLKEIISCIVDDPEKIEISQSENNGITTYHLNAPKEQVGKLIGKEGKVINSIRNLLRVKAIKTGQRVLLKISELQENRF